MNNSRPIRIGIIGGGGIVKAKHIPGFSKLNNVSITGICNRTVNSSQNFAKQFNVEKVYSSPEELITSKSIDAVLIGTWPYKHCEYTLKSLAEGKHVFIQARMCMNLDEAKLMNEASIANPHLATMICPSPFGFSADMTIRQLMKEHYVGKVLTVKYTNLGKYNPEAPLTWRHLKKYSGLNIMAVGIYYETISRWVGPAEEVFALKSQNVLERLDTETNIKKKVEIEDDIIITGRLKNGGSFDYHFGSANHSPSEKIEIYGTEGSIVFHFDKDLLQTAKRGDELKSLEIETKMKKEWNVEHNFIHQMITGEKQEATFEEGLSYMAFTQGLSDSGNIKGLIDLRKYFS